MNGKQREIYERTLREEQKQEALRQNVNKRARARLMEGDKNVHTTDQPEETDGPKGGNSLQGGKGRAAYVPDDLEDSSRTDRERGAEDVECYSAGAGLLPR